MVLHHVANGADLLVKGAAALHAELLGHGDLHVLDVVAVPNRLEKCVGETEIQKILHRLLAQIVIDAKDGGFGEHFVQRPVERLRRCEIAAEGLLDDDPGIVRAPGFRKSLDDARKHARRNGQVVDRPGCAAQGLLQFGECRGVGIVAVDVAQQRRQFLEAVRPRNRRCARCCRARAP